MEKFNLMATAAAGIETLVNKELKDLGYETQGENGRIRFQGTIKDIINTNLWLRTADRVKIIVGEFDAVTFDELFEGVKALPWDELLPIDAEFPVEGRSRNSQLHNVPSAQAITKKAIVEKMNSVYHRRTDLPETGALYPLEVMINKDHVIITLDTTGSSLFKRGYRIDKGGAPLKENMAAALVLLAHWFSDNPFVDPVCGSGTIPIEAALIGRNIAPGFNRNFVCESWSLTPEGLSDELRAEADEKADYDTPLQIFGYDIDPRMIEIAKANAQEAGLAADIHFETMAAKDWQTDLINGVLVANPPYGERLGDEESVRQLYSEMGDVYRPMKTWSKYILTSDLEFEDFYGARATKKRKLYNGSLRTDLFQYWGKKER